MGNHIAKVWGVVNQLPICAENIFSIYDGLEEINAYGGKPLRSLPLPITLVFINPQ